MEARPESQPNQARVGKRARFSQQYPMELLNGLVTYKDNRRPPSSDFDQTPIGFRRYVNASGAQDVQIWNALRNRIASGLRITTAGAGWFYAFAPRFPGSATRPDIWGGTHKRGIDPLSYSRLQREGPGSQPANPGGPGKIAGNEFHNPMTG